jgi:hypothetical protein
MAQTPELCARRTRFGQIGGLGTLGDARFAHVTRSGAPYQARIAHVRVGAVAAVRERPVGVHAVVRVDVRLERYRVECGRWRDINERRSGARRLLRCRWHWHGLRRCRCVGRKCACWCHVGAWWVRMRVRVDARVS